MNVLEAYNSAQQQRLMEGKKELPVFGPGDTLAIFVLIKEGEKQRVQRFEGVCIARTNRGIHSSYLVRRSVGTFSVERRFSVFSPLVERVEVLSRGRVRRAKLYYLRQRSGKSARIKEKRFYAPKPSSAEGSSTTAQSS